MPSPGAPHPSRTATDHGGIDPFFWGAGALLLAAIVAAVALASPDPAREPGPPPASPPERPAPTIAAPAPAPALPREAARVVEAWQEMARELCADERLTAVGIDGSCETGSLTLRNRIFFEPSSSVLSARGRQALRVAAPVVLEHLQRRPRVWESLEALEVRGHADPWADRDPYVTNLVLSQARALAMTLFLTTDEGIAERHRADLREIAVASGASHSRPPADCPEPTRECNEVWRRVELRPVMDDALLRSELAPRQAANAGP